MMNATNEYTFVEAPAKRKRPRIVFVGLMAVLLGVPAMAQYEAPYIPPAQPVPAEAAARVVDAGDSLADHETALVRVREQQEALEANLGRRGRALYRMRRAGMLPVAGGVDAMLSHLGRMERLERLVTRDLAEKRALRLEANILQSRIATAQVEQENAEREAAEAARAVPPDHGLRTFFDPNYTPRLTVAPVPQYGLHVHGRSARTFAQQRGELPMPVTGGGNVTDASREDGSGLEFAVPAGREARSVAEGRVAFARRYGMYGTMVVVDHGHSYFTVYAGLAQADVHVGDSVRAQQRLGTTAGSLYFEVRRGSRSLDPRSWIGL